MDSDQASQGLERRILVVDNEAVIRLLLSRFLEQQNYVVETAADGVTALERFDAGHFDVIMVDLQMPGMTGLEVARAVRQRDPHIPIALITGVADTLDENTLQQAGITRLFTKPFALDDISNWLQSL